MDRNDIDWKGYWVACPTPFEQAGALDEAAWRAVLNLYLAQGVHGVLVNGTTGEWFAQTDAERRRVAEIAVEELGGKIPVVIGCTTYTPAATIALGRHAKDIGADGFLSTPPPYAAPPPRDMLHFFQTIADGVDLPLMVYNWARGVVVEIMPDLAEEIAGIDGVVALKDSTTNRWQAIQTLERVAGKVRVFGGFASRVGIALMHDIGGDGSIDGGAIGAPFAVDFYEAFWRGDIAAAKTAADAYGALMGQLINPDWSGRYGAPQAQIKACMALLGQPGGFPRPPLLPVDAPADIAALKTILEGAGLMPVPA